MVLAGPAVAAGGEVVDGLAIVQADGTLSVGGRLVRLYGIYLPPGDRTCRRVISPPRCASKSVLVLDDKVDGFVRCEIVAPGADGVPEGICTVRGRDLFGPGEDLAAFLLQEGFALVRPDGLPEYFALERLARSQELGLWGDKITNFR